MAKKSRRRDSPPTGPASSQPSAQPSTRSSAVERWWATPRGAAALVAAVTLLAYARSLGNEFTYDEGLVIVQAQGFLRSGALGALFSKQYFAASLEGTWRPVCTLTYMIDAAVALHPAVFKAQSIVWHVGAAFLVMALARRLLPPQHRRLALVGGLLFALHPVATETVDNASFREDGLVTVFVLAMLLLSLRGRRWAALGAYALALLSKESAVVAPALLVGVRLVMAANGGATRSTNTNATTTRSTTTTTSTSTSTSTSVAWGAVVREVVPFGVLTVIYLVIRFGPMRTPMAYASYPGGTLVGTLAGMPRVWLHYLRLLVAPWPLCADYTGYFRFGGQPTLPVLLALAPVLGFVALIVVAARRGEGLLALGLGWFALALGPVSNFIPVPIPAAERFLYLPMAGIALAACAAAAILAERLPPGGWRVALLAGTLALAALALVTNRRHADWRDDETLWKQTVARNPRSCGAQSAVGGKMLTHGIERNDKALLRASISYQQQALALCPDGSDTARAAMTYTRLGAAQALLGELPAASAALERAIALQPRYALPVAWLGYARWLAGDRDQAAALLKHAVVDLGPPDSAVAEVAQRYLEAL